MNEKNFFDISLAKVANEKGMQLNIQKGACVKCGISIQFAVLRDYKEIISVANSEGGNCHTTSSSAILNFKARFYRRKIPWRYGLLYYIRSTISV